MSEYKTEIGRLNPGSRFYFPNDVQKNVWTVLDTKRQASNNAIFIFCEDPFDNIQDFNSNRDIMCLRGDSMPFFDDDDDKKKVLEATVFSLPSGNLKYLEVLKKYKSMEHTESNIKIYHSNNYSLFNMINGNRQLNQLKIKRILKDIDEGLDILRYCPVLVKENGDKLDIIDGQHRFYVSRKKKSGIYYIIADEMSLQDIAKINSNTDKWKDSDFINCYVQQENGHYQKLQEFIDEYKFPIGVSITLLTKGFLIGDGGATASHKHKFRSGEFEIKELEKAHEIAGKIKLFSSFPGHTSGGFVEAIGRILKSDKIKLEDLHQKFIKDPFQLTSKRNAKEYLTLLETIYNQNNRIRKVIY